MEKKGKSFLSKDGDTVAFVAENGNLAYYSVVGGRWKYAKSTTEVNGSDARMILTYDPALAKFLGLKAEVKADGKTE